jgi:hypothetical protein
MDILDEMTKAEIIQWLRGEMFFYLHKPKKSDLLGLRWQAKSEALAKRNKAHTAYGKSLNLKKRDEIAKQINATKNLDEKLCLFKKMKPYEKGLDEYLSESKALMAAEKRLDKLYAQIDIERQKER